MKIMELDASFFGFEQKYSVYGLYTYTEDWQEYPDYSSDPPVNQGDFLPIIDNPDRNKYYPITISGQNYKIYNSAVLNIDSGIYFCIISDYPWNSYQLWHDGRQSGEAWVQYQSNNSLVQNGIYTCSDYEDNAFLLDSNGFIYNPGSYLTKDIITLNSFGTDLPVFTDIQSYMDYITNPLISATVKLTYYIPAGDYQYTKLTYKKDKEPASVNDGTIVNLDLTQDSVIVEGLVENANYWFKIFTSKSESEAFPYTVGEMSSSWQNVSLPCVTGTSSNDDLWTTPYDDWVSNLPDGITLTYLPPEIFNIPNGGTSWLFGDSSWGIKISCGSASDIQMSRWYNNTMVAQTDWFANRSWITSGLYKISIFAAKNDVENKGSMPWIINYNNGQSYFISTIGFNNSQTYDWLNQST